ncbi:Threonylcarbamoyladenosine tRNA methylthiotransferase MtaB [Polystyrenella longa]|uniref:Threonylcarbamoyladenosine tRNA methylthiotransferase MtaB n=1 Tax=Polystyrenella longa TaxID=2528007 RepID=A0A518CJQ3_9PLAN|nr:tRNA (N(6)-L-threonylcarbamoyladenosine(37)-C(2))-methylthiotransferase MtaB [Polystyrenella longa]QDU79455.1 Threonylcarbamoyladenosine tRNA methylthiotransferase MtaB [Polystyrenella longa]
MSTLKCKLVTLGCKVNQYETQLVQETLLQNGYELARDEEAADLCVVNTCTVTNTGDSKSRQVIRRLAKDNPAAKTIVMGCYATRDPEMVSTLPNVFEVVTDKRELPDVFNRLGINEMPNGISYFDGRHRAFVKVQDGCILRCTYCIIPSVRPGLRSRPAIDIVEEVKRLLGNGYREIVLSGIHVGHYGVDTTRGKSGLPPYRIWDLFEELDRIPGDWRMRLSSIEAPEINEEFISAAANCEHLCPQFHPALQSGSETVLRRMRRRYSISKFLDKIEMMRERLVKPSFTTDVIVGFPGETEAEFEETMESCRQARFIKTHVFPYSQRKGTPAAKFEDQVPPEVRKERCQRLANLERDLALQNYEELVEDNLEVLVERECEDRPGWVRGTDRRYAPVELPGSTADVGNFVVANGLSATRDGITAERITPMRETETESMVKLEL